MLMNLEVKIMTTIVIKAETDGLELDIQSDEGLSYVATLGLLVMAQDSILGRLKGDGNVIDVPSKLEGRDGNTGH